jgi:hypothetical protein
VPPGHFGDAGNLAHRIDGAPLGADGQADRGRLGPVRQTLACPADHLVERVRRHPAGLGRHVGELGPTREQLSRAAFAGLDVRPVRAHHRAIRRRQRRERDRIRCGASRYRHHPNFSAKKLGEGDLQRLALRVLAIGLRRTHVDASERRHNLRRCRGDVVGVQVSKEQRRHRYGWDGKFCLKEVVEVQPVQVFKKETRRGAGSVEVARQCGGRRWPRVRNRTRQPAVGSAARPPDLSRNRNLPSVFPLQCPVAGSTMWRIVRNLWLLRAVWRWWRQRR